MVINGADVANPPQTAQVQVFITVIRDNSRPFFLNTPYGTTVDELAPVGTNVFNVSATDRDLQVFGFPLLISAGDYYFMLNLY